MGKCPKCGGEMQSIPQPDGGEKLCCPNCGKIPN